MIGHANASLVVLKRRIGDVQERVLVHSCASKCAPSYRNPTGSDRGIGIDEQSRSLRITDGVARKQGGRSSYDRDPIGVGTLERIAAESTIADQLARHCSVDGESVDVD